MDGGNALDALLDGLADRFGERLRREVGGELAAIRRDLAELRTSGLPALTIGQFAELNSLSVSTVRRMIKSGALKVKRAGRSVRIPPSALPASTVAEDAAQARQQAATGRRRRRAG
jgi:excisionase family DNA binding protein